MGLLIRTLEARDRSPLRAALEACGAFSPEEMRVAADMLDAAIAGDDYAVLAAEIDGEARGYISVSQASLTISSWYIYWICVHPAWQRRGAGLALLGAAEAHVAAHGGERLVLETSGRPDYAGTRIFYERAGYGPAGRVPDFYKPGDDLVIYFREI